MRGEQLNMSTDESGDVAASSSPYTTSGPTSSTSANGTPSVPATPRTLSHRQPPMNLQEENARSAFEITSVTDAPADADDLESSMRNPGQSSDEQQLKENLTIRKGGDAGTRKADDPSLDPASLDNETLSVVPEGTVGGNGPTPMPGATQQASRFRRVNEYKRERWTVRDTSEPEERAESCSSEGALGNKGGLQLMKAEGTASPFSSRRAVEEIVTFDPQHTHSTSDLQQQSVAGGGGGSDTASERGDLFDRSSTAAETASLSRNTSFSSLPATEKLADNDEHLQEVENDRSPPVPTGASSDPVTYPPSPLPSTPSSHGATASAEEHSPTCSCESCEKPGQDHQRRVTTALSSLNEELQHLLKSNARLENLAKQNNQLQEENERLHQEMATLTSEKDRQLHELQETVDRLEEENRIVVQQLQEARNRCEELLKDRDQGLTSSSKLEVADVLPPPAESPNADASSER